MKRRRFLKNVIGSDASRLIIEETQRYNLLNFQDKQIVAEALVCAAEKYLADGELEKMLQQLEPRGPYAHTLRGCGADDEVVDRVLRRAERFFTKRLGAHGAASAAVVAGNEELLKAEKRFLFCHRRVINGYRKLIASFRNGDQPERIFKLKTEIRFLLARLAALEAEVVMGYFQAIVL